MDEKRAIKANGLELIQLDSQVLPLYPGNPEQKEVQHGQLIPIISRDFHSHPTYVVAYLYSAVIIGKWENDSFLFYEPKNFDEAHILKLRVFNQYQELLVWKSGNTLKARLRKDNLNGRSCDAVVADHVLAGTRTKPLENGWIRIREERGGALTLPFQDAYVDTEKAPDKRIFIRTYNYIDENQVYQSTYADCRFVGFTDGTNFLT